MSMTKKDYELVAGVFSEVIKYTKEQDIPDVDNETVDTVARFMASTLSLNNPKFDRKRFLEACGLEV